MEIVLVGEPDFVVYAVFEKPEAVGGLLAAPSPPDQLKRRECREPQTDAALSGKAGLEQISTGQDLQGRNCGVSSTQSSTSDKLMSGLVTCQVQSFSISGLVELGAPKRNAVESRDV